MIIVPFTTGTTNGVLNGNAIQIVGARVYFGKVGGAMTKTEVMNVVKNIRNYMVSGNPIWDKDTVYEALSTAIDALERTDTHECVDPTHECVDLISRADAIYAIVNTVSAVGLHDNSETARYGATYRQQEILTILESLPSADRPKGKWIPYLPERLRYKCSECESKYDTPWHFCPNCGSYNGGESDDKG